MASRTAERGRPEASCRLRTPPTAIFVGGDRMAIGVLAEARSRQVRLPDDLAVIGADGDGIHQFRHPAPSTVAKMMYEAAQQGAG
nr:substrate-binding domain-containing protein [Actinopolymorpha alba]